MRVIVEAFGRAWAFEASFASVRVVSNSEDAGEEIEHLPVDPHSTLACHAELSPAAVMLEDKNTFGFGFTPRGG